MIKMYNSGSTLIYEGVLCRTPELERPDEETLRDK